MQDEASPGPAGFLSDTVQVEVLFFQHLLTPQEPAAGIKKGQAANSPTQQLAAAAAATVTENLGIKPRNTNVVLKGRHSLLRRRMHGG